MYAKSSMVSLVMATEKYPFALLLQIKISYNCRESMEPKSYEPLVQTNTVLRLD